MEKAGEILRADAFLQIAQHVRQLTAGQNFAGALVPLRAAFGGGTVAQASAQTSRISCSPCSTTACISRPAADGSSWPIGQRGSRSGGMEEWGMRKHSLAK